MTRRGRGCGDLPAGTSFLVAAAHASSLVQEVAKVITSIAMKRDRIITSIAMKRVKQRFSIQECAAVRACFVSVAHENNRTVPNVDG